MTSSPHSSWAHVYDRAYEQSFGALYTSLTEETINLVCEQLPLPARIVDFGAGTGRLSLPLSERGYDVVAVDPCGEMLAQLKAKAPESGIILQQSRMQDFAGEGDFDFALCVFTVLLYLTDIISLEASLHAAFRSLKPGGLLLIDVPFKGIFSSYSRSDNHIDRKVTVIETSSNIFTYREDLTIKSPKGDASYNDEFQIRYWPEKEVKQALMNAGFHMTEDCSDRFEGTGSSYYLMKKPKSRHLIGFD